MTAKKLTSLQGGKKDRPKTSTCISCDDEGRIWTWMDSGKRSFKFCWCEIGQEMKKRYCEEKGCKENANA